MTNDGLRGVAYHEAGHAVVALALDLRVARVEIFDEDYSGATDVVDQTDHLPVEDRIALCVAGMNANWMFKAPTHELAFFQDYGCVQELISDIDEAEGDVLEDKGHQRASDLLTRISHRTDCFCEAT